MADTGYTLGALDRFLGKELGVSDWLEITQERIDTFADVTEDHQWIHEAGERAAAGPYGAPIAHGLLLLGLTVKWAQEAGALPSDASMCVNYGYDRIRFPAPVAAGQRVRCRVQLLAAQEREQGHLLTTRYTVEIEGVDKPALVADCLGLFYR